LTRRDTYDQLIGYRSNFTEPTKVGQTFIQQIDEASRNKRGKIGAVTKQPPVPKWNGNSLTNLRTHMPFSQPCATNLRTWQALRKW
jgi:hypothetical protein